MVNEDHKSQLLMFLQKKLARPMSKKDLVFETSEVGGSYQSKLTLVCLDNIVCHGEAASTPKEAEREAAGVALQEFGSEVSQLVAKRAPGDQSNRAVRKAQPPMKHAKLESKAKLLKLCSRILGQECSDEDIAITTVEADGIHVSTVAVPTLPGHDGETLFQGETGATKELAEASAIATALENLSHISPQVKVEREPKVTMSPEGSQAKQELNNWVMKILRKENPKGVLGLSTTEHTDGFQCSLNISVFPGEFGQMSWEGSGTTQMEAEQEALIRAHNELGQNAEFAEMVNSKPAKAKKSKSKSGGTAWPQRDSSWQPGGGKKGKRSGGGGQGGGDDGGDVNQMWQMFQVMMQQNGFNVPSAKGGKGDKGKGNSSSVKRTMKLQAPEMHSTLNSLPKPGRDKWVQLKNLPPQASEEHLRQLGEQISQVNKAVIVSPGQGRIEFGNKEDAAFALPLLDGAQVGENIIKATVWR